MVESTFFEITKSVFKFSSYVICYEFITVICSPSKTRLPCMTELGKFVITPCYWVFLVEKLTYVRIFEFYKRESHFL